MVHVWCKYGVYDYIRTLKFYTHVLYYFQLFHYVYSVVLQIIKKNIIVLDVKQCMM